MPEQFKRIKNRVNTFLKGVEIEGHGKIRTRRGVRNLLDKGHYGAVFSAMDKLEKHKLNEVTKEDVTDALNKGHYLDVYNNMMTLDKHKLLTPEHKKTMNSISKN